MDLRPPFSRTADRADWTPMQRLAADWTAAQPVVGAFVGSLVPNHHDAEDVLQRTAAALVELYAGYDAAQPFARWAMGVARVEVMRFRQKRGRERASFDTDAVEAVAAAFEAIAPAVPELRHALNRCIDKLNGRVRDAFELHYRNEWPVARIAGHLNRSAQSVTVALHRGRQAVRDCLRRHHPMEGL